MSEPSSIETLPISTECKARLVQLLAKMQWAPLSADERAFIERIQSGDYSGCVEEDPVNSVVGALGLVVLLFGVVAVGAITSGRRMSR
jgi:hypothetical protein